MSKCRGCGAEISWVRTRGGKMIPVNPRPVYIVDGTGRDIVVTQDGSVANGIISPDGKVPPGKRAGWITHFATCPLAREFRRRG
jgi:hypothetical protein